MKSLYNGIRTGSTEETHMGRRGSINEAQVFEAADALVAQGREVTPTVLLSTLGSGSFTTIYKHLSTWEASRASAGTERSAAIPEAVLSAFGAAWRVASAEANKEVVMVREQSTEEVKAAKAQFQEALQTIERLESESEADAGRIEAFTAKVAELESSLHKAENEKSALKATTEQLRQQVKSQEAELERVHKDSDAERKRHQEELSKAAASAASAQEKANADIQGLREQLAQAQRAVEKSERERGEVQVKIQEATGRADKADARTSKAEQELEQARKEKENAIKEAGEMRGRAEALTAQNKELISQLGDGSKSREKGAQKGKE
jgi:chromosome segregation ATPase